jgi:hypothetical protein
MFADPGMLSPLSNFGGRFSYMKMIISQLVCKSLQYQLPAVHSTHKSYAIALIGSYALYK